MLIFTRYTYWVAAMLGLAVLLAVAGRTGTLDPVQNLFLRGTSPIERVLDGAFRPVATFLGDIGDLDQLRDENRRLRVENEELRNRVAELQSAEDRVRDLEEALNITIQDPTTVRLPATVVSHPQNAFQDEIRIDQGSADGIAKGNPVVSAGGSLLGTVTEALPDFAFVRLITDSRSRVAAVVREGGADGIVSGEANRTLTFDFVEGEVNLGDTVVTSGLGGAYPADIPIGLITEVSGDPQDPFPTVVVESLVRISTTDTVFILTDWTPVGP